MTVASILRLRPSLDAEGRVCFCSASSLEAAAALLGQPAEDLLALAQRLGAA